MPRGAVIFGPLIFPLFALAHLVFAVIALGAVPTAPAAAIGLVLVELVTCYDNGVVALGNRLGISTLNQRLNRLRFFLHAVCIAGLIPAYAGIGRLADAAGFDAGWFNAAITVLTAGLVLFGYFIGYRPIKRIMPVNYYGCLRYAQAVNPASRRDDYAYSAAELEQRGMPPLTSILTVLIGLVLSLWLGLSAGFWVPAIVTGLMMLAGRLPANAFGALNTSCLEIVYSAGMVWSLVSLAARTPVT